MGSGPARRPAGHRGRPGARRACRARAGRRSGESTEEGRPVPRSDPQKIADTRRARGDTPVVSPNTSGSMIWPRTMSQATIQPSTRTGISPARRNRQGDQRRQERAQRRAGIGNVAQGAAQQAPQDGVRHADGVEPGAHQRWRSRNWSGAGRTEPPRPRRDAASTTASVVACTSPAPASRTTRSPRRSRSSRMKTSRMTMMPTVRIGPRTGMTKSAIDREGPHPAVHAHRRRGGRRRPGLLRQLVAERGDHGIEAADHAIAFGQLADLLHLVRQVRLVAGDASSHIGKLGQDECRQQSPHRRTPPPTTVNVTAAGAGSRRRTHVTTGPRMNASRIATAHGNQQVLAEIERERWPPRQ